MTADGGTTTNNNKQQTTQWGIQRDRQRKTTGTKKRARHDCATKSDNATTWKQKNEMKMNQMKRKMK